LHAAWILADERLPQDRGLYYHDLPAFFSALRGGAFPFAALLEPGAWYNLLLAALFAVFGRSVELFRGVDLLWVLLLFLGVGGIARRLHGEKAAFVASALLAAMPVVVVHGRMNLIHTPEAALVVGLVWAWVADRRLERWRTRLLLAVAGGLVLALRPTGLVWVGALLPFLVWGGGRPSPWRGLLLPLGIWFLCAIPDLLGIAAYLGPKVLARGRYAAAVPSLLEQLRGLLGGTMWLAFLLAPLGFRRSGPPGGLFLLWTLLPFALWALFRAGLDNFPLLAPGLALLASGASVRRPRLTLSLATLFLLLSLPSRTRPALGGLPWVRPVIQLLRGSELQGPQNFSRPWAGYGEPELKALLTALCPRQGPCRIVVGSGLLHPEGEECGSFELFLAGVDDVEFTCLQYRPPPETDLHALVRFACQGRGKDRGRRGPGHADMERLVQLHKLLPVWGARYDAVCEVRWYVPEGRPPRPEAMPAPSLDLGRGP
jgi:hypothetical protein